MSQGPVVSSLEAHRIIAVIHGRNAESARQIAAALVTEGIQAIEISFATPGAAELIARLRLQLEPSIIVGAGSLRTAAEVRRAVASGANFLASPGIEPEVVRTMLSTGKTTIPGVFTPSEVMAAAKMGAETVKLSSAYGSDPSYLSSLMGEFPDIRFIPTCSVADHNVDQWISHGALAVGIAFPSSLSAVDEPRLQVAVRALLDTHRGPPAVGSEPGVQA